jgi:hypothetical protein
LARGWVAALEERGCIWLLLLCMWWWLLLLKLGLRVLALVELRQLVMLVLLLVVESPFLLLLKLWSLIPLHSICRDCIRNLLYQCTHVACGRMCSHTMVDLLRFKLRP